jgi:Kef-type K+ transport system membrane component KefB
MNQTTNFILAVFGFILLCAFIAKFVMKPLFKKFPALEKANETFLNYTLVRDILHIFK